MKKSSVKEIAVTTNTWSFKGQKGVDTSNSANLRLPSITYNFIKKECCCKKLSKIIDDLNLGNEFMKPEKKGNELKFLTKQGLKKIKDKIHNKSFIKNIECKDD